MEEEVDPLLSVKKSNRGLAASSSATSLRQMLLYPRKKNHTQHPPTACHFINSSKKGRKSSFQRVQLNKGGRVQCHGGTICSVTLHCTFSSGSGRKGRVEVKGILHHLITDIWMSSVHPHPCALCPRCTPTDIHKKNLIHLVCRSHYSDV